VLPHFFPAVPGFQFAARSIPSRQVGGDFYDIADLDENHLAITIADVSDKGMPAALYMVLTRTLLVAQSRKTISPSQVLGEVNQLIQELSTAGMFVTIFYGVLEKDTARLRYARAGHDQPILLTGGKQKLLGGEGIALGVMEPDRFLVEERELQLEPGDRLVLYTDGLTDVFSTQGEIFGRDRLSEILGANTGLDPDRLCDVVLETVSQFQGGGEQFDDQTMLVVDVKEKDGDR